MQIRHNILIKNGKFNILYEVDITKYYNSVKTLYFRNVSCLRGHSLGEAVQTLSALEKKFTIYMNYYITSISLLVLIFITKYASAMTSFGPDLRPIDYNVQKEQN